VRRNRLRYRRDMNHRKRIAPFLNRRRYTLSETLSRKRTLESWSCFNFGVNVLFQRFNSTNHKPENAHSRSCVLTNRSRQMTEVFFWSLVVFSAFSTALSFLCLSQQNELHLVPYSRQLFRSKKALEC
jgi:hypothetical protein